MFEGKTIANVESDVNVRQLELLITTRQTHPLLGLNWMEQLGITLETDTPHQTINHVDKPDEDTTTLKITCTNLLQTRAAYAVKESALVFFLLTRSNPRIIRIH